MSPSKLRVDCFGLSIDGFGAGPDQSLENPLGVGAGGGAATIRQYLQAGLIDELHLAVAPVLLGSGENLFSGIDLAKLGYSVREKVATPGAMHVVLSK